MKDIDRNKIKRIDGGLLLVLRELLRQRRTTVVAERLFMSQSAVSHALARLRELFDDELFVRRPHGLEPTRHALELAPRIDALLDGLGDALGLATSFDPSTTTRSFRLAAPDFLATLVVPPLLARFARTAPRARFAFSQRLGQDALSALERDDVDLALGQFLGSIEGFAAEPMFDDHYCMIARRGHPRLRKKITRALYAELGHVQVSVGGDFRSPAVGSYSRKAWPHRTVAAVPRFLMALAVVGNTDAVAVVPHRLARAHAQRFGLALHELPFRPNPIHILAVRRPHDDPATRWLLDQVKDSVAHPEGHA